MPQTFGRLAISDRRRRGRRQAGGAKPGAGGLLSAARGLRQKDHAREQDLLEGLALSVELDEHPSGPRDTRKPAWPRNHRGRIGGRWINGGRRKTSCTSTGGLKSPAPAKSTSSSRPATRSAARRRRSIQQAGLSPDPLAGFLAPEGRAAVVSRSSRLTPIRDRARGRAGDIEGDRTAGAGSEIQRHRLPGDSSDWFTLVNGVITGASYHASLVSLAARLIGSNMHDGTAIKLLRAIMSASTAPHDAARWQARFDAIPRIVSLGAREISTGRCAAGGPLPFIDMQPWDSTPARSRPWAVIAHPDQPADAVFRRRRRGQDPCGIATVCRACHWRGLAWRFAGARPCDLLRRRRRRRRATPPAHRHRRTL